MIGRVLSRPSNQPPRRKLGDYLDPDPVIRRALSASQLPPFVHVDHVPSPKPEITPMIHAKQEPVRIREYQLCGWTKQTVRRSLLSNPVERAYPPDLVKMLATFEDNASSVKGFVKSSMPDSR